MRAKPFLLVACFLFPAVFVHLTDQLIHRGVAAESILAVVTKDVTQGVLRIVGEDATVIECPLIHTDVKADISGFVARVKVTQTFKNPAKENIEAVYVFPLPHESAVDGMTMVVGRRRIVGLIKRRQQARDMYEQALQSGHTAALLEQERPNIFTQSVGNIEPGQEVNIEISYVDVLKYDMGTYEFHYPMVVGPRYHPQQSSGQPVTSDTSKLNPPVLKPGERTGHDISLTVNLDAGVPIQNLKNTNHKVHTIRKGDRKARVRLLQEDSITNKDFVLRYDVVGKKPELATLAHTVEYSGDARRLGKGYFMLMIQPQEDERLKRSPPREVVFLVDVSGSMGGPPSAKVRDAMNKMLKLCRASDTMQIVTFAGHARKLFNKPVAVNKANIERALLFTDTLHGAGGTEMIKGVKMAIDEPLDEERSRIVVMLTDGHIGNESQIIRHVGENCGKQIRFWAIGIGQSPNMFLIDGVARQGGGMGKNLGLRDDATALTTEVMTRIQHAQLRDIKIDWGDLQVCETFPANIPELWAGRPVIVFGRYRDGGEAEIKVSGTVEGESVSWPFKVALPKENKANDVLAKTWARQKIEDLMHQTFYQGSTVVQEEVTAIALNYRLMTQYTSFVAIDSSVVKLFDASRQQPRRMTVPVPLPEGTKSGGLLDEFGEEFLKQVEKNEQALTIQRIKPDVEAALRIARSKIRSDPESAKVELKLLLESVAHTTDLNPKDRVRLRDEITSDMRELERREIIANERRRLAQENQAQALASDRFDKRISRNSEPVKPTGLVKPIMGRFDSLMKEKRWLAAEREAAARIHELAPDNPVVQYANFGVRFADNIHAQTRREQSRQRKSAASLRQAELSYVPYPADRWVTSPDNWYELSTKRQKYRPIDLSGGGEAEKQIANALAQKTEMKFFETPLADVLEYIEDKHGIQIELDTRALNPASIGRDTPITLNLSGVSLRSALRLMLKDLKLTCMIQDEVLMITTQAALANYAAVHGRLQAAGVHDRFGWQLLAAAADGRLDKGAFDKLRIAWLDKSTDEILAGKSAVLALRSLWMISEASRALPDELELRELADTALAKSRKAWTKSLESLKEKPKDDAAYVRVLYAALAQIGHDGASAKFLGESKPLLTRQRDADSLLAQYPIVANALLNTPTTSTNDKLIELLGDGVYGEELAVLTALACRRSGRDTWSTFRAQAPRLIGEQPLPGHVVLLVNRLSTAQLPIASTNND